MGGLGRASPGAAIGFPLGMLPLAGFGPHATLGLDVPSFGVVHLTPRDMYTCRCKERRLHG